MVPELPTKIARISAVLTLVGSLIWVQWPIDFEKFNIAAIILFIAALATWFSIELADLKADAKSLDSILSADVDKTNSLLKIVDKYQYSILKEKAVQTYMHVDDYRGLQNLLYFRSIIKK